MGIYIKGMEMPNPGHIVLVEIDENGDVFAAYDGGRTKLTQHKAVSVPPHGRLIDADKLDYSLGIDDRDIYVHWTLEDAPTIIPADPAEEGER